MLQAYLKLRSASVQADRPYLVARASKCRLLRQRRPPRLAAAWTRTACIHASEVVNRGRDYLSSRKSRYVRIAASRAATLSL